jgi:hypothetical protein
MPQNTLDLQIFKLSSCSIPVQKVTKLDVLEYKTGYSNFFRPAKFGYQQAPNSFNSS